MCIVVESERGSGSKSFFCKEIIIIIMATTVMAGAATISAFLGGGRLSSSCASSNSSSNNNSPSCSMTQLAAVSPARALTTPCSLLVSTHLHLPFAFPKMGDLNFDVFLLYLWHHVKVSHFSLQMSFLFLYQTDCIPEGFCFKEKRGYVCLGVLVTRLLVVSGVIILALEKISCGVVVL